MLIQPRNCIDSKYKNPNLATELHNQQIQKNIQVHYVNNYQDFFHDFWSS